MRNISAFLTNPARRKQLLDALMALLMAKSEGRSLNGIDEVPSARSTSQCGSQDPQFDLRVLLVEDNRVNLMLADENLKRLGCKVATAEDGKQAIERVEE